MLTERAEFARLEKCFQDSRAPAEKPPRPASSQHSSQRPPSALSRPGSQYVTSQPRSSHKQAAAALPADTFGIPRPLSSRNEDGHRVHATPGEIERQINQDQRLPGFNIFGQNLQNHPTTSMPRADHHQLQHGEMPRSFAGRAFGQPQHDQVLDPVSGNAVGQRQSSRMLTSTAHAVPATNDQINKSAFQYDSSNIQKTPNSIPMNRPVTEPVQAPPSNVFARPPLPRAPPNSPLRADVDDIVPPRVLPFGSGNKKRKFDHTQRKEQHVPPRTAPSLSRTELRFGSDPHFAANQTSARPSMPGPNSSHASRPLSNLNMPTHQGPFEASAIQPPVATYPNREARQGSTSNGPSRSFVPVLTPTNAAPHSHEDKPRSGHTPSLTNPPVQEAVRKPVEASRGPRQLSQSDMNRLHHGTTLRGSSQSTATVGGTTETTHFDNTKTPLRELLELPEGAQREQIGGLLNEMLYDDDFLMLAMKMDKWFPHKTS